MKKTTFWFMVVTIGVFLAGQAFAAEPAQPMAGQQLQGPHRTSQIVGMAVQNPQGQKLGKIDELVIGENGMVTYAILSHGGLLGIGDKLVPIPWSALKPGPDENTLNVNIDKPTMEKAPNFDPKEWPNFTDPGWQQKSQVYYGLPEGQATGKEPGK